MQIIACFLSNEFIDYMYLKGMELCQILTIDITANKSYGHKMVQNLLNLTN
jgi:hypothetical protein